MDSKFRLRNIGTELLLVFKDTNKFYDGYRPEHSPCRSALLHSLHNIHSSKFAFWRNSVTGSLTSGFWEAYCVLLNRKILNWTAEAKWHTDEINNSITRTYKHPTS